MAETTTAKTNAHANAEGGEANTTPSSDRVAIAVWDALTASPGTTAQSLAAAADVSVSVARRVLKTLAADGRATRTKGTREHGKRTPDTWHPIIVGSDAHEASVEEAPQADGVPTEETDTPNGPSDDAVPAGEPESADEASTAASEQPALVDTKRLDQAAAAEAEALLERLSNTAAIGRDAMLNADRDGALAAMEELYGVAAKARRAVRAAVTPRRTQSGRDRARPGALRDKVRDHLASYRGAEFTAHELGKALGHSAGAVANALDRLLGDGVVIETCARPRRFTAA